MTAILYERKVYYIKTESEDNMKTITHEEILRELAQECELHRINYATVKTVMLKLDELLFYKLAGCKNEKEDLQIKALNGITINRKYIPEQEMDKGMFKGQTIKEHYNVKANVSDYYNKQLNNYAFYEDVK